MERVSRETRSFVIVVHYNVVSPWAKLVAKWAKCQALFLYHQNNRPEWTTFVPA